jgi:hypothetical protein
MNGASCVLKSKTGSLRISKAADLVACPDATFMFGKGRGFWIAGLRGRPKG